MGSACENIYYFTYSLLPNISVCLPIFLCVCLEITSSLALNKPTVKMLTILFMCQQELQC